MTQTEWSFTEFHDYVDRVLAEVNQCLSEKTSLAALLNEEPESIYVKSPELRIVLLQPFVPTTDLPGQLCWWKAARVVFARVDCPHRSRNGSCDFGGKPPRLNRSCRH